VRKLKVFISIVLTIFSLSGALIFGAFRVSALGGGFSVTPIFPENQVHDSLGFFDLLVRPGMRQTIQINITNTSSEEVSVTTTTFTPTTNINGIIDYGSPGTPDETLSFDFAEIALPEREVTVLSSGETELLTIDIAIPDEGFDGIILGAIHTINNITDDELAKVVAAGSIVNRYTFTIPVRLQISHDEIKPELIFGGISTRLINHRAAVVAEVRNPLPRITRDVTASAAVYSQGENRPVFTRDNIEIEFAPHSVFPLAFVDEAGIGLAPGNYTAVIKLEREGNLWEFNEDFEILATEANEINSSALNLQIAPQPKSSLFAPLADINIELLVASATVFLLLIVVSIVIIILRNEKKDFIKQIKAGRRRYYR